MIKELIECFRPNPLDQILKKAMRKNQRRFLIIWNRGLGDIPLGLYALNYRIRSFIPDANITYLTRKNLEEGFKLLGDVHYLVGSSWERRKPIDVDETLKEHELSRGDFDLILESPDPTRWLKWQLGKLVPKLSWDPKCDSLCDKFNLGDDRSYIGVHVDSETGNYYGYEKNWPKAYWLELFENLSQNYRRKILLFGNSSDQFLQDKHIVDLRGKTTLTEVIAIIKNHCSHLIVPDSGILSVLYYVDTYFPIKTISLWADPRQGVLRQRVASPNKGFKHIPLIGKNEKIVNIKVKDLLKALFD